MTRRSHAHDGGENRPRDLGVSGLSLFDAAVTAAAQLQTPVPSAPGSEESRAAAEHLAKSGAAQREVARCHLWFAEQTEPRTRHELAAALYGERDNGLSSACGRVDDLLTLGFIEKVGRVKVGNASRGTLRITKAGLDALKRAAA